MTVDTGLSCQEFVEIVTEYLEGELPAEERLRLENHLRECDGCSTYLDQMRQTLRIAGKLSEDHISPQAQQKLLEAFRGWKKRAS